MDKKRLARAKDTLRAHRDWYALRRDFQLGLTTEPDTLEETVKRIERKAKDSGDQTPA